MIDWFRGRDKTPSRKHEVLVADFRSDSETDNKYLHDMVAMNDREIEWRLTQYKISNRKMEGMKIEEYLKPYIEAVEVGRASEWEEKFRESGNTDYTEKFRVNAAKVIIAYRKRKESLR